MQVIKLVDRELTKKEQSTIRHFIYYTSDADSFALIGENVVVITENFQEDKSLDNVKNAANKVMEYTLSVMPDFSSAVMDDGCGIAIMHDALYAISEKEDTTGDREGKLNFIIGMELRNACMEACENGEIIAVYTDEQN